MGLDAYRTTPTGVPVEFDKVLDPGLALGVDVLAPGTLIFETPEGEILTYVFDSSTHNTQFPHRLCIRIRKIIGDGEGGIGDPDPEPVEPPGETPAPGTDIPEDDMVLLIA